jgi:hypothetical protein
MAWIDALTRAGCNIASRLMRIFPVVRSIVWLQGSLASQPLRVLTRGGPSLTTSVSAPSGPMTEEYGFGRATPPVSLPSTSSIANSRKYTTGLICPYVSYLPVFIMASSTNLRIPRPCYCENPYSQDLTSKSDIYSRRYD